MKKARHPAARGPALSLILALLLAVAPWAALQGVEETHPSEPLALEGGFLPGDSLTARDDRFPVVYDGAWADSVLHQEAEGRVSLRIDHTSTQLPAEKFPVTIELEMIRTRADGTQDTIAGESLTVDFDPFLANGDSYVDQVVYRAEGAHLLEVEVTAIQDGDGSPLAAAPGNLVLEAEIVVTRFDELASAPLLEPHQVVDGELEVSWLPVSGAEEYHLEWLHVNDYRGHPNDLPRPAAELAYDFRFDSTRITTSRLAHRISLIFEEGWVLYRLRAVGRGGADFDLPVYGAWTAEAGPRTVAEHPQGQRFRIARGHEGDALNWQHITNFAEEGKKKENVSYFDGSLRNRQVVSRLNTAYEAIAGETIYDHQGRAAVQVLPAPTGAPEIRYYRNLNQNLTAQPYDRENFDLDLESGQCEVKAEPMRPEDSGAAHYYSSHNPRSGEGHNAYIPRARGYPFTQIEFEPDNTGRIRRQGGVGPVHQLGSVGETHATRYYYGKPSQEHLDRLFGSEVGGNSHYKKNMVVDANGQASVSYLDQQGRVIATALAGNTPDNVESLGHTPYDFEISVLDNSPLFPGDSSLASSFHHLAASAGEHTFGYTLERQQYEPSACPLCFECVYRLQATVLDQCGETAPTTASSANPLPIFLEIGQPTVREKCQASLPLEQVRFATGLGVAKYNVHKGLAVDEAALQSYLDAYLADGRCARTLKDFMDDELARTDFSGCQLATECDAICDQELPADATRAACITDCERIDGCRELRGVLLGDVTPGGQYATFAVDDAGVYSATDPHSLFHPDTGPYFQSAALAYDPATVVLPGGEPAAPQDLSVEDFVRYWQPGWAEALLGFHPEVCAARAESCAARSAEADWERQVREVDSFEEAFALGFFNPLGLTPGDLGGPGRSMPPELATGLYAASLDPLFPSGSGPWQEMRGFLTRYTVTSSGEVTLTTSVWGLAVAATACAGESTGEAMQACIDGFVFGPLAEVCSRDRLWQMFRALYLAKREELRPRSPAGSSCPATRVPPEKERRIPDPAGDMTAAGFGNIFAFDEDPLSLTSDALSTATQQMAEACPANCAASSGYWMVELAGCQELAESNGRPWEDSRAGPGIKTVLEQQLEEVCRIACAGGSPHGQSQVPDGYPGTEGKGYESFSEAVAGEVGETSLTCNGELISSPFAYGDPGPFFASHRALDTCGCDALLTARWGYQEALAGGELPAGGSTLADFFAGESGFELQGIAAKVCACERAFRTAHREGASWQPGVSWPDGAAALLAASGEFLPSELSCTACIRCDQMRAEVTAARETLEKRRWESPKTSREQAIDQQLMTHHLNEALGFHLSRFEYADFISRCAGISRGETVCGDLTPEARDLERLLEKLALHGELFSEPLLCQKPYRETWINQLAPAVAGGFSFVDQQAPCGHIWIPTLVDTGHLSAQITNGGCCSRCELSLEFVEPGPRFDDLIHFVRGSLRPDPTGSTVGTAFLIDAVVVVGGNYVTVALSGEGCFPIASCTDDPAELALCDRPGASQVTPDPEGRCEEQLVNLAMVNAEAAYEEYVRVLTEEFRHRYTAQCLAGSRETFTMAYQDDEHHHTLYYYDQAGNLIKTVPPEGVELLTDGLELSEQKNLFAAIALDRSTGQRNVFTTHRMATSYQYNSLNQLVRQHMPDHDAMERWDFRAVALDGDGLGTGEDLYDAGFAGPGRGWVLADDPEGASHGTVYLTADGGNSWQRAQGPGQMDLRVAAAPAPDTLYAAGEGGAVLAIRDGGAHWSLEATGAASAVVGLHFRTVGEGLAFARDGEVFETFDGAESWSMLPNPWPPGVDVLKTAHFFDNDHGVAAGHWTGAFGEAGTLLVTADGGKSWSPPGDVRVPGLAAFATGGGVTYAAGADGRVLRRSGPVGPWRIGKAGHRRAGEVDPVADLAAVAFFDAGRGVAGGQGGFLRYTKNGGVTWTEATVEPSGITEGIVEIETSVGGGFAGLEDGTVLSTNDFGVHWTPLGSWGPPELTVLHAAGPAEVYAGGRTSTGAPAVHRWPVDWTPAPTFPQGTTNQAVVDLHLSGSQGIVLLSDDGLFRLQGTAFVPGGGASAGPYVDLEVLPGAGAAYAITASGSLAKSMDFGASWDSLANPIAVPSGAEIRAFHVTASGEAFAATDRGDLFFTPSIDAPGSWTSEAANIALPELTAVETVAPGRAYAAGSQGSLLATTDGGTTWTFVATEHADDLAALDLDAGDSGGVAGANGLLLVGSGLPAAPAWTRPPLPAAADGTTLRALDLGASPGYAAGDDSLLLSTNDGGVTWSTVPTSSAGNFHALARTGGTVYAVGDSGWIGDGSGQQLKGPFRTERLAATHHLGEHAWVVGADGLILRSDDAGHRWTPQPSGTREDLHGVYFTGPAHGVAVGEAGTILRTSDAGGSWQTTHSGGPRLTDVHFGTGTAFGPPDPQVGVAVGEGGTILRTSNGGASWQTVTSPTSQDLAAVYFVNQVGFAAGSAGTLLRSRDGGASWEELRSDPPDSLDWVSYRTDPPATADLLDVYFRDYVTGYALGQGGILLKTINGGLSWNLEETGGHPQDLRAFTFSGEHQAFLSASDGTGFLLEDLTDRHSTRFYYDKLGRLVASQNSKQFAHGLEDPEGRAHFSYTRYDPLGRIVEVGQLSAKSEPTEAMLNTIQTVETADDDPAFFPNNWSLDREQVTRTFYTFPMSPAIDQQFGLRGQQNLRNRVASAAVYDEYDWNDPDFDPRTDYDHATHYSYDIHGNVQSLIQDNPRLGDHFPDHRFKRIDYRYDLVSGNVNEVLYQEDQPDAFYHRYQYDADNRLTTVHTSHDKVIWDRDATYEYYRHGPLARMVLGEHDVQGVDYAYTLQGWIKGVNSVSLRPERDIGKDGLPGSPNAHVAPDVYGYTLGYFPGDYEPIGPAAAPAVAFTGDLQGSSLQTDTPPLYNGNIGHMTTALAPFMEDGASPQAMSYRYDQLNRLKSSTLYPHLDPDTNRWGTGLPSELYATSYEYDANGNLTSLRRNGKLDASPVGNLHVDELAYVYAKEQGKMPNNRLLHVTGLVHPQSHHSDIDDQGGFTQQDPNIWNYEYDAVGNLARDRQREIRQISWDAYGKIRRVAHGYLDKKRSETLYQYDAYGSRVLRRTLAGSGPSTGAEDTWYTKDVSGTPLATYHQRSPIFPPEQSTPILYLFERYILGSSRLGVSRERLPFSGTSPEDTGFSAEHDSHPDASVLSSDDPPRAVSRLLTGHKQYELSNHLGSVLATVSDRGAVLSSAVYFPFGMIALRSGDTSYRFSFQGEEGHDQDITNWIHFKLRAFDPRLGRWISMDPEHQFGSPFLGMANNPIRELDTNGAWVPGADDDGNIILTAQKGDDLLKLVDFFGDQNLGSEALLSLWNSLSENVDGKVQGATDIEGFQINLTKQLGGRFEQMTMAINAPDSQMGSFLCYSCSLDLGLKGEIGLTGNDEFYDSGDIHHPPFISGARNADKMLMDNFYQLENPDSEAIAGVTLVRFGSKRHPDSGQLGLTDHYATFLGRDSKGTVYLFTKNGANKPTVMTIEDVIEIYSDNGKYYGFKVLGIYGGFGYYNPNSPGVQDDGVDVD